MFVHINKKASFTDELKSKYVNSIVFIKDSQEIWTHNTFYAIPEEYKNKISELEQKVDGSLIFLTQEEYDLLGTDIKKDAIYIITNDTPELKVQGPFVAIDGLLEDASTIEEANQYIFKVNNDYFFIHRCQLDISLPNDPSSYKQITGNFEILNTEQGKYEYCVPEVVNIESLDDIGMENLLRDTVIVDSFESYGSVAMNYSSRGFYSETNSESGHFYGFYVDSSSANISLNSNKSLTRYSYAGGDFTYNFPNYLCTYQIDGNNILIQKCLNRNNQSFYEYLQEFEIFKTNSNIEEVELIRKSNTLYDKELTAIGKKLGLDLSNRLDFGVTSGIIVGRIAEFGQRHLNVFNDVEGMDPGPEYIDPGSIDSTHNIYWLPDRNNYLVLAFRSDKIIPEPTNVVKLRVKNDLTTLKYDSTKHINYFPVSIEKIEEFKDDDVSGFLSNIIVPAVDGIDRNDRDDSDMEWQTNPWTGLPYDLPTSDEDIDIQTSSIYVGLKIGKGNPDFANTYEYRFSEYRSTFKFVSGGGITRYYSPIRIPGDKDQEKSEYAIDQSIESYVSEVISKGKYERLVYNTNIGFNCPSYIIPSLYQYLHLNLEYAGKVLDSAELIAPSNCRYDTFIKALEATYNIDLSNRFSYDEGTVSNYMLLYVKTKTMN